MTHGWIVLHDCFGDEEAEFMLKDIWVRLGLDPDDKKSWKSLGKVNLPDWRDLPVSVISPKAWGAICDLLGGEDRVDIPDSIWRDAIIPNLGEDANEGAENWIPPRQLANWHCDGDFFLHFLDSREQGLLITPIYSKEIKPMGGGTMIAPQSLEYVAKQLYDHPEGILPGQFGIKEMAAEVWTDFVEMTGKRGDVFIAHPFMGHSASCNSLRIPRFIANSKAMSKDHFRFDRPAEELCLVEKKTLQLLGKTSLHFEAKAERKRLVPARVLKWVDLKKQEEDRLNKHYEGRRNEFFTTPFPRTSPSLAKGVWRDRKWVPDTQLD